MTPEEIKATQDRLTGKRGWHPMTAGHGEETARRARMLHELREDARAASERKHVAREARRAERRRSKSSPVIGRDVKPANVLESPATLPAPAPAPVVRPALPPAVASVPPPWKDARPFDADKTRRRA